uniref:RRM domain-containing protein n=1 Tax=Anas platyrhynchos TaxID=8839 RepID=A0A8B9TAW7_ANAPL
LTGCPHPTPTFKIPPPQPPLTPPPPYQARERDVERFFKGYGKILEVDLKNGYGFVEFDDLRDADDAVYELNGKDLCGERVIVEHARGPRRGYGYRRSGRDKYGPPTRTEYRLIVENLSSRCSWQDLKDYMRQAGEVTYADAHKGRKNEGVIEFKSYSDMKRALEKLDGTEVNELKPVFVWVFLLQSVVIPTLLMSSALMSSMCSVAAS